MKNIIIVCNALDDETRNERNINTDSPAASRKVFMLADVLMNDNTDVNIISMGRGKSNGHFRFFKQKKIHHGGVNITYLPFTHIHILSEVISLLYVAFAIIKIGIRNRGKDNAVIFYNRLPAYLLGLLASSFFSMKRIIDIEDGEVYSQKKSLVRSNVRAIVPWLYDSVCQDGAILACGALSAVTKINHTMCYYGTVSAVDNKKITERNASVIFLLSGSLSKDTGADRLVQAIHFMRAEGEQWLDIKFEISGQGPSLQDFQSLMDQPGFPIVTVYGRLSNADYNDLLMNADVGMALKPVSGSLANTTFPSKVVEYANYELLVLTTEISDVRSVLGDAGALFLKSDSVDELIQMIGKIKSDTEWGRQTARVGKKNVLAKLAPQNIREKLISFIFNKL